MNLRLLALFICAALLPFIAHSEDAPNDPPGLEWIGRLESKDAESQAVGERQLKKMGAKAVPALKAALDRSKDDAFKAKLYDLLDWCEGGGEPVNGISVKLSTARTLYMAGEKVAFRILYRNHTNNPLVVRLGLISGMPFKQLKTGSPAQKEEATQIFYEKYKEAGFAHRTLEFPAGVVKLISPLSTTDDGEERKIHYRTLDGRGYTIEAPNNAYTVVSPQGSYETTFEVQISDRIVKSETGQESFKQVFAIKPEPCIILKGPGPHPLKLSLEESDEAPKNSSQPGDNPDTPKRYMGIGEVFRTSADRWTGSVKSNEVSISIKE